MSEESENINQQNDLPISSNTVNEDNLFESCNEFPFNDSKCTKDVNDFDDMKCSNANDNNLLQILKTINATSMVNHSNNNYNNTLIKTNNSPEISQLSQIESKILIAICSAINANIDSQDEKIIMNVIKKHTKYTLSSNVELTDINTQQFIDLNLNGALQKLLGSQPVVDVSKKQYVQNVESNDSVFFTPLSIKHIPDTVINSKSDNKDVSNISEMKMSDKLNYAFPKTDVELTNQINDDELRKQNEDSEIINFRAMCEAMTKIGTIDKQMNITNHDIVKNQMKNISLKKMTEDVLIVNDNVKSVCSTSEFISFVNFNKSNCANDITDSPERLKHKRQHCYSPTLNLFSDSSLEYFNELSQKQLNPPNKKKKITSLQNNSKISFKSCPKKIKNQSDKKKMNHIILTSSEDEDDCIFNKNQLSKFNSAKIGYKRKSIDTNAAEQNKLLIGKEQIFYCSPDGLIHRDMIKYINQKHCNIK